MRDFRGLVVTASNRAAAGVYEDRGGPILVEGLRSMGFTVEGPVVVPDGEPVEAALRSAVDEATTSSSPPAAPGSRRPT